jgi:hypothetical protein
VGVLDLNRQGLVLDGSEADWVEFAEPIRAAAERLRVQANEPATRATAERALAHLYRIARAAS